MDAQESTPKQELTAKELKERYQVAHALTVEGEGRSYQVFLKKPTRQVMSKALSAIMKQDLFGMAEIILQSCMAPDISDTDVMNDDTALASASLVLVEVVGLKQAELKKL